MFGDDVYEPDDPKFDGYAERMFERIDLLRKKERENPPLVAPREADECDCGDC